MEAKLRAMESRLRLGGGGGGEEGGEEGAGGDLRAALPVETVSFHFKEGLPTAADFNKSLEASKSGEPEAAVAALKGGVNGVNGH